MKIGIIGAGNIGVAIGKRLAANGHSVAISFARSPDKLAAAAEEIGHGTTAVTEQQATVHGEVVIIATPWAVTLDVVDRLADALAGKVVWDTTNPLNSDMSGLVLGTTTCAGEEIANAAPKAKVVKAIAPFAEVLQADSTVIAGRKPAVFVCGDDEHARSTVLGLVADLEVDGIDAGPLTLARYTEPLGMLLAQLAYVRGMGARIGAAFLRERQSQ